ncbi:MAG: carbohydrate ABC transporter permease [Chloroflexi bacterium]|nr:carbohydrate ABC transporter permease [Chloroflexota bacterium]MDE2702937.1 carbohydrate ABC transporter permease [Chloroflexota bacterium]MDE2863412.1 carbohydrate ABC transporter permease [Chloroflexota bacterium]MDE2936101.1 carbohydrate ABC transporter permease [Chloroflexota bacterium]MXW27823.1 carbohydrate ABC transporter permease [Chloroflexota bacterium]
MAQTQVIEAVADPALTIRSRRTQNWRRVGRIILYAALVMGVLFVTIPYLWMLSASLKEEREIYEPGLNFLPNSLYLQNYIDIVEDYQIIRWLFNSFLIGFIVILSNMTFTVLAGYAFARLRWPGRDIIFYTYLGAMMIPIQVRLIPSFIIIKELGWVNTYQGIASLQLVEFFGVFLIRQFMLNMPRELEDAARIDGCGWFRVLWQIIIPNSKPALAALAIFTFTASWNNFLWPLVVINQEHYMTIQVGLASMKGEIIPWGLLMAGTMISAVPLFIVYIILQKLFTQGIVMSGIKG